MDKVIVIGCSVNGYAVIRALAGKDIYIIAITYAKRDIAQFSRYVSEVVNIPIPWENENQFIAFLISNASRWKGALLLETSDGTANVLSKNKEVLSRYYRLVTPDWETLSLFIDKEQTYALAKKCNIPYPRSTQLSRLDDIKGISEICYPCILKPTYSSGFVSKFLVKNFEVNNDSELEEKFNICLGAGQSMLLQEVIPGPDENLFKLHGYINSRGQMVGKFFYQKLRQSPARFGVMRVGISTVCNPEVEQLTERLLRSTDYQGYFNTEFKRDPRDGELKLMEVNCRMPRGGMLPTASGVNYPWIIYLDLVKNQQIDIQEYKQGFYWIELFADLSNSLFHRNGENIRAWNYIKPYLASDKVFADLDFQDMKPFTELTRQRIRNLWRRVHPPRLPRAVLQAK